MAFSQSHNKVNLSWEISTHQYRDQQSTAHALGQIEHTGSQICSHPSSYISFVAAQSLQHRLYDLKSQKYLVSGHLQEIDADTCISGML